MTMIVIIDALATRATSIAWQHQFQSYCCVTHSNKIQAWMNFKMVFGTEMENEVLVWQFSRTVSCLAPSYKVLRNRLSIMESNPNVFYPNGCGVRINSKLRWRNGVKSRAFHSNYQTSTPTKNILRARRMGYRKHVHKLLAIFRNGIQTHLETSLCLIPCRGTNDRKSSGPTKPSIYS